MGGEPWLVRKPYEGNVTQVLNKHKGEILGITPDWPEVRITERAKVREGGDGWPDPESMCCLAAFDEEYLKSTFGTAKPSISIKDDDLWNKVNWDDIPRGEGHFLVLYKDDKPTEVCFLGYSLD